MKTLKKLVIVGTLLLSLVGGAGQASADPGIPPAAPDITSTPASAGVTWEGFGLELSAGVTWE